MAKSRFRNNPVYACVTCGKAGPELISTGRTKSGNLRSPRFKCDDGHKVELFGSAGEYLHYKKRQIEERVGIISRLKTHPVYPIIVNGIHIADFSADLTFWRDGKVIVEDFKGYHDPRSTEGQFHAFKCKLVHAIYGVTVEIVTK